MRVLLGLLGGIIGLVLFFVALFSWVIRHTPKGSSVGVDVGSLVRPPFLLWEVLSFAIGFTLAYIVLRSRA